MWVNNSYVCIAAKVITINTNISHFSSFNLPTSVPHFSYYSLLRFFLYSPFFIPFFLSRFRPSVFPFLLHVPNNPRNSVKVTARQHDREIADIGISRSYSYLYNVHIGSRSHPVAIEGFLAEINLPGFEAHYSIPSSGQVQNTPTWSCA
jgi:hypothetical protein